MRTRSSCLAGCVRILPLCRSTPPVPSLRGLFLGRIQLQPSRTSKRFFGSRASFSYGSVERHAGDECQPLRRERLDASARSPIGRTRTPIGRLIDKGGCVAPTPPKKRDARASLVRSDQTDSVRAVGDDQPPPATPRDSELIFPPLPQPLVDSHGGQRFYVERFLNHRDVKGQRTSYLVRWCGYPPSHDSWGPLS
uniref:Chromo domain-containing protein n=1 Tax=Hyaloperonospora arabidopsidis (strain Emoy2) TaxID=559515 RepID=M4B4I0_HYAAE